MTTGRPPRRPSSSRPTWPGAVAAGQPGQVGERDRDGVLEVVGQAAEPGAQDDPDVGHEVGAGADGRDQRVAAGAGWSTGGMGRDGSSGRPTSGRTGQTGHAGLQDRVQGVDGRGPRLRAPDGSIDTGMPITSRRAHPADGGRGETAH